MDNVNINKNMQIDQLLHNRRRHIRSTFAYPVKFKVFFKSPIVFEGHLKDISMGGACLRFQDKYGRFNRDEAICAKVKMLLSIPQVGKYYILANIKWAKKIRRTLLIEMGIEFSDMDNDHLDAIKILIGMKNKDHNMMWNLWEEYTN